ncbi:MGMT family protein [Egicoccus sp. AB-alg6-2]|uniref:MGMT family protein n=1 Tax=Egicoccus sp. AB-alg6-2 TaxID=3242692 RepID=UPI00359EF26F
MSSKDATDFRGAVVAVLQRLTVGEVVSYGEVAAEAGRPGAARAVGTLLRTSSEPLPWWRVVTASGRLVPGHEEEHARRLHAEGVATRDGRVVAVGGRKRAGAAAARRSQT